jgi:hypothetical protein
VKFMNVGVREWLKSGKKYNTIFMFVVIEHFETEEGLKVLADIQRSLTKDGVFFGSTPLFKNKGASNFEHKNEFHSEEELVKFLRKVFREVDIFVSEWPESRSECYFECKNVA